MSVLLDYRDSLVDNPSVSVLMCRGGHCLRVYPQNHDGEILLTELYSQRGGHPLLELVLYTQEQGYPTHLLVCGDCGLRLSDHNLDLHHRGRPYDD